MKKYFTLSGAAHHALVRLLNKLSVSDERQFKPVRVLEFIIKTHLEDAAKNFTFKQTISTYQSRTFSIDMTLYEQVEKKTLALNKNNSSTIRPTQLINFTVEDFFEKKGKL